MINSFRKAFPKVQSELLQWYPGHMDKGLKQMQQKLKTIDCIIEVHDSRIPLSGRNSNFKTTLNIIKPHILVLNKIDLSNRKELTKYYDKLKKDNVDNIILTNCKNQKCNGVKSIIPMAEELILNTNRFNRSDTKDYCIMIIGIPNVGKSSLVNILRNRYLHKKSASQVGAIAGITRSVLNKIKISETPLIYLLDTPGILTPRIDNCETGLKLSLISCLQDHLVGETLIADYLLYWLNKNNHFDYINYMDLKEPTDDIDQVLLSGARKLNKTIKIKNYNNDIVYKPDLNESAKYFIKLFRNGDLGKFILDNDLI